MQAHSADCEGEGEGEGGEGGGCSSGTRVCWSEQTAAQQLLLRGNAVVSVCDAAAAEHEMQSKRVREAHLSAFARAAAAAIERAKSEAREQADAVVRGRPSQQSQPGGPSQSDQAAQSWVLGRGVERVDEASGDGAGPGSRARDAPSAF
uniref:Uncharacterized protein n=1 Tax=Emiliania huxleyi TaxID=2903 RepID=A0A7S3S593_EMIHU